MRRIALAWVAVVSAAGGCAGLPDPLPADAGIRGPLPVPLGPEPGPTPAALPDPPEVGKLAVTPAPAAGVLTLDAVLVAVAANFPLLLAVEQEREIAAGRRLAVEGAFDLVLRGT